MNKEELKKALTEKGISFDPEATNKQLTELLNNAETTTPLETTTTDTDVIKPSAIDVAAAKQLAAAKPVEAPKGISEEAIQEKVRHGLRREQAIEVLQNQAAHDAALKAAEKGKA